VNTSDVKFRDLQPADIEKVVAPLRSNIPKYFVPAEEQELRDYLAEHPEHYYILESQGETVGAGGVALSGDGSVGLCWGMVPNDVIGTGLGRRLTFFRMEKAREKWGDRPFIISTSQHTEGFYRKLGFETIEHIRDGFRPGIDTCKMVCG
jgi:N-acetylglutamate synthase-like GNAT family acetyltransferase